MRWRLCWTVSLVWAGSVVAAPDDLPREVVLLAHFKQHMRQILSQVPNYTCLETIQRSALGRHKTVFRPLDVVLLEVSNIGEKELLAWPGARRFDETDLTSFTTGGLMGSGVFALLARNVFVHQIGTIRYFGDEEIAGRPLARFDFAIPAAWSGYQIRANGASAVVRLTGSFWIDAASLELVRMEVRADEIPPALGIERTVTVIDYARMHIGDSEVLLPQDAKMLMDLLGGEVRRNEIGFSHCHEYLSESSIRFDMPDTPVAVSAPRVRQMDLPAGLTVSVALDTAIDSNTAHVGDLLRGHVVNDVRRKDKTIIIPKGAIVTGRIRGVERLRSPGPAIDVTVELAELESENWRAQFYGELLPKVSKGAEDSSLNIPSINGQAIAATPSADPVVQAVHSVDIPGTGVLHMAGAQFRIAAGFRMNWRTLEPNQGLPTQPARADESASVTIGVIKQVDCLGKRFRLVLQDDNHKTIKLLIMDLAQVAVVGNTKLELSCGSQSPRRVRVEYIPKANHKQSTKGEVATIEFQ
jgi:hypothetical protein